MKTTILFILVVLVTSCTFVDMSSTKTYQSILTRPPMIVLKKSYSLDRSRPDQLYVFDGTKSEWYDVNDTTLMDRLEVGDTLHDVVVAKHTYYKKPETTNDAKTIDSLTLHILMHDSY